MTLGKGMYSEFRIQGLGFISLGFRIQGFGLKIQVLVVRVQQDSGFRV